MQLGSTPSAEGTHFAIYSSVADNVELCFFDTTGKPTAKQFLSNCADDVWHDFVPGCRAGQRYGFRIHGPWAPEQGLRCNPAKLMLDPYAKSIEGELTWNNAIFDYELHDDAHVAARCTQDNAPWVPFSVVCNSNNEPQHRRPHVPWKDTVFYECNVRGFTMQHPAVAAADRGKFAGMHNADVLAYIKALGVTSIELMPIQTFIDEQHLARQDLRNFWGYNTVGFFAPMSRYGDANSLQELKDMVRGIHDAGLEVILDVAYNHTGEGDFRGPSLSFRGIDNLSYYRVHHDNPARYVNDTGCGNTINADHPRVQQLILDSLGYFAEIVGVDGFRFDLATVLGRHGHGFSSTHPLLLKISNDARLRDLKLIAEPWDPGPGGYQLGQFPPRWAEWNDKYRDTVRKFWRGDPGTSGAMAQRLHGSADVFENSGRPPFASINFIASHDGFTLRDVVSYEQRHNEANGEDNLDGHERNYSCHYGEEGETNDERRRALRRRQRLNMLACLFFSQGTPLLLAGDEFGHTQYGNNNAYAQDNRIGWLDWSALDDDPEFTGLIRDLIWLRRETALLRFEDYIHGSASTSNSSIDIRWLNAHGESMRADQWSENGAFTLLMTVKGIEDTESALAIVMNSSHESSSSRLPATAQPWRVSFSSGIERNTLRDDHTVLLEGRCIALLQR